MPGTITLAIASASSLSLSLTYTHTKRERVNLLRNFWTVIYARMLSGRLQDNNSQCIRFVVWIHEAW